MKKFFLVIIIAAVAAALALTACEREQVIDQKNNPVYFIGESEKLAIPAAIQLPDNGPSGNIRVQTYYAVGVQKYRAQAKTGTPGSFEWIFVAPQADLYDVTNMKLGTHSAGPTWQIIGSTTDSIYAQAFTPAKSAPSPDANSIDWLLLKTKEGKVPTGVFAQVAYIQRIATSGGKAPATSPTAEGQTVEVPYSAVYRFTKKN